MIRQSSIEPKKYVQNQLLLKKNKDKIGNIENTENSPELSSSPQKPNNQVLELPDLFSSPDDNKTITEVESIDLDSKTNTVKKKRCFKNYRRPCF